MRLAAESVLSKVPVKCDANVGDSRRKMNLITVWLQDEKRDVFTAKTDMGYRRCAEDRWVHDYDYRALCKTLSISNAARKLNKTLKQNGLIQETVKVKTEKLKRQIRQQSVS